MPVSQIFCIFVVTLPLLTSLFHHKMAKKTIPGLSFSWKRALGITRVKQQITRKTGIPTSKAGLERKIGSTIIKLLTGKK